MIRLLATELPPNFSPPNPNCLGHSREYSVCATHVSKEKLEHVSLDAEMYGILTTARSLEIQLIHRLGFTGVELTPALPGGFFGIHSRR